MNKRYVPDAGDIIWLHFDLPNNSKAQDYKAALVLSPLSYNKKTGLVVCCAITSNIRGYPFEVLMAPGNSLAVLADQVKSLDWAHTKISHHGRIDSNELGEVRAKLHALILKA